MKDYLVCSSDSIKDLEDIVNAKLEEGYSVVGSLVVDRWSFDFMGANNVVTFWQPVAKIISDPQ